jgi:ssDNA-binding Zn-finger/Zn-ribbon topoisomerase 1
MRVASTVVAPLFPMSIFHPEVVRMTEASHTAPLTLVCPDCNCDMVRHSTNKLEVFACSQYPKCKKTLPALAMKTTAGSK